MAGFISYVWCSAPATADASRTLLLTEDVIIANATSGTFTLTLPAASNVGKVYEIKKTDSSFNSVIIDGSGSDSIDGTSNKTLNSKNEAIRIVSDGTSWSILNRYIPSSWTSYSPSVNGLGSYTSSNFRWRRNGANLEVQGNVVSGTASSAEVQVTFPTGITSISGLATIELCGKAGIDASSPSVTRDYVVLCEPSVTYFTFGYQEANSSAALSKKVGNTFLSSGQKVSFFASVPIVGWDN